MTTLEYLDELLSGRWRQHCGSLANDDHTAFCCLGVGVKLVGQVILSADQYPTAEFLTDLPPSMWDENHDIKFATSSAAAMNDRGESFAAIAQAILEMVRRVDPGHPAVARVRPEGR